MARTNLELQELYMKNAITRSLDDPVLQEMPVVPTDHIGTPRCSPITEPVQEMIADALKNRTELQESSLELQNSELSRKTARNALLPSLLVYGFYAGTGYGGTPNPSEHSTTTNAPGGYRRSGGERVELFLAGVPGGIAAERSVAQSHRQGRPVPDRTRVPAVAGVP